MRVITYTANLNGNLNRDKGTTFIHLVPAYKITQPRVKEDFEIKYKINNNNIVVGIATIESITNYAPGVLSETLTLVAFGYPAKSVLTMLKKWYPDYEFYKHNLMSCVFRWKTKLINGFSKVHYKNT